MDESLWNVEGCTVGTECGLWLVEGTLHRGLMVAGRAFLGQEGNHWLQVKGEVV